MHKNHLFCFGLGYTGLRLVKLLRQKGWSVSGTVRDKNLISPLKKQGVNAYELSYDPSKISLIAETFFNVTHIISTVPPIKNNYDPILNVFYPEIAKLKSLKWLGYLSTTGVYGNTNGCEVSECATLNPTSKRAHRRLEAEKKWRSLVEGYRLPLHIFRLPGIYGPQRSSLTQIQNGLSRRIIKPDHKFNRIHVDDIVNTLYLSMHSPKTGAIYNIADDEPAAPSDVIVFACGLLGVKPPPPIPFEIAKKDLSDMALSFWHDNRRVSNKLIKKELGVVLNYPSYREGLTAIYEEELLI